MGSLVQHSERNFQVALSASVGSTEAAKDVVARFGRSGRCSDAASRRQRECSYWPAPSDRAVNRRLLALASRTLSPSAGKHLIIGPRRDRPGHLLLLPRVHVVGSPDHDGVHATRAARQALGAGLDQFQISLRTDFRFTCTKKSKKWTTDTSDCRFGCFLPEEVSIFCRGIGIIQKSSSTDERRELPIGKAQ